MAPSASLLVFWAFLSSSSAFAEGAPTVSGGTLVFPPRGVNVAQGDLDAVSLLVRERIKTRIPGVVPEEDTRSLVNGKLDDGSLLAACRQVSCSSYVTMEMIGLSKGYLLQAELHDGTGATKNNVEVVLTGSDDLVSGAGRLAESLLGGPSFAETVDRHNVVDAETVPAKRAYVERNNYLRVDFLWALDHSPSIDLNMAIRSERDLYFTEIAGGGVIPTTIGEGTHFGGVYGNIGLGRFFRDAATSGYASAALGPRLMWYGTDGGIGIGGTGELGVLFGRQTREHADVHVRLGLDYVADDVGPMAIIGFGGGFSM
jgi:hypothetical protein